MFRRRVRRSRAPSELPREYWSLLNDEPPPEGGNIFRVVRFIAARDGERAWKEHDEILTLRWTVDRPGTRPSMWWLAMAPEPRRMVGGVGHFIDYGPHLRYFGIPRTWTHVDTARPPLIESQATYLGRFGLFVPGERKRIKSPQRTPEVLPLHFWPTQRKEPPNE